MSGDGLGDTLEAVRDRLDSAAAGLRDRLAAIDRREVLINLGVALVTVLLVVGAVEAAVRVGILETGRQSPSAYEWCEGPESRSRFHADYGWTEHPGHVYLERQRGEPTWDLHRYNAEGFRDLHDSGNRSVVVVGDSFTRGSLADNNATYPHLLDRWTPDVAFRNYGTGGYSTGQSLIVYRNVSERIDHDLVILGYYLGNDAGDNVDRSSPKRPRFDVVDGELELVHEPVRTVNATGGDGDGGGLLDHPAIDAVQGFLRDRSAAYRYFEPRVHVLLGRLGLVDFDRYPLKEPPSGRTLERQLTVTGALIEALGDEAKANGAELLVATIPERGEVDPDKPLRYDRETGGPYWDAQRAVIDDLAANHTAIDWIDTTSALRDRFEAGERVYGRVNAHLDERGYMTVAERILEWTEDHNITDVPPDVDRDATIVESSPSCPA